MLTDDNLYESVQMSLTRLVEDFREQHMPEAEHINWDAHANLNELPEADVIGLAGLGLAEDDDKQYEITFGILMSTYNDATLTRLTRLISRFFACVAPQKRIQVYSVSPDGETALETSWMVAALPRAVTPVSRAEVRAVQGVEARLLLDPGALSRLRSS